MRNNLKFTLLLLLFISFRVWAGGVQNIVQIGDLKTVGGDTIRQCKVGYLLLGHFNPEKTNAILWPTWYTGTSNNVSKIIPSIVDTSRFAVIVIDALGNGVSSSPSNTERFPKITIRDMVNSQHKLLVSHFGINHIYAVGGISMGGMQTLEWLVAYPEFMDKAISIVGTPKQSFRDLLLWQTELALIEQAKRINNPEELEHTRRRLSDIQFLELYTPEYFEKKYKSNDLQSIMSKLYKDEYYNIFNLHSQLEAMIDQDIYRSSGKGPDKIWEAVKANVLIIVAVNDHMVNPQNSIILANQISCKLELVDNECGHNLLDCGFVQVENAIHSFLK